MISVAAAEFLRSWLLSHAHLTVPRPYCSQYAAAAPRDPRVDLPACTLMPPRTQRTPAGSGGDTRVQLRVCVAYGHGDVDTRTIATIELVPQLQRACADL